MYYLELVIKYCVDSFEEFFEVISAPTSKHIRNSFIVSLGFLVVSLLLKLLGLWGFVGWDEALTCCVILGVITLIDGSVRSSVGSSVNKIKSLATKIRFQKDTESEFVAGEEMEVTVNESNNE